MVYGKSKGYGGNSYGSPGSSSYGSARSSVNYADSTKSLLSDLSLEGFTSNIGVRYQTGNKPWFDDSYKSPSRDSRINSNLYPSKSLEKLTTERCMGNCRDCPRRLEHGRLL